MLIPFIDSLSYDDQFHVSARDWHRLELQERLKDPRKLKMLPYLGVLLKDHQDMEELT